ncbi:hypothetical protein [Labrys monachus]|uniref:Uncharacterized protein n=1 Tax=Labrys monachus TaxID=217067 RepID=A0ABU0F8K8_9HYPH|nr:hypothetical protein [Labrys monachus]MDQ0390408.1 hypothetical protein [Labrys monachus]
MISESECGRGAAGEALSLISRCDNTTNAAASRAAKGRAPPSSHAAISSSATSSGGIGFGHHDGLSVERGRAPSLDTDRPGDRLEGIVQHREDLWFGNHLL